MNTTADLKVLLFDGNLESVQEIHAALPPHVYDVRYHPETVQYQSPQLLGSFVPAQLVFQNLETGFNDTVHPDTYVVITPDGFMYKITQAQYDQHYDI